MRFGSVVFSIRNSIIGMRSQTSEVSSSVVYTATTAWDGFEEPAVRSVLPYRIELFDPCSPRLSAGLSNRRPVRHHLMY